LAILIKFNKAIFSVYLNLESKAKTVKDQATTDFKLFWKFT